MVGVWHILAQEPLDNLPILGKSGVISLNRQFWDPMDLQAVPQMRKRDFGFCLVAPHQNPNKMPQGSCGELGERNLVRCHVFENQPRDREPQEAEIEEPLVQSEEYFSRLVSP